MNDASVSQSSMRDWSLDLERGLIIRAGKPVAVRHKLFEILSFLARNPNRVISKDELVQAIWGGAAITDDALTQTISQARKCIGDETKEIIRTIPKRGFFFASANPPAFVPVRERPSDRRDARQDPAVRPTVAASNPLDRDAIGGEVLSLPPQICAVDCRETNGPPMLSPLVQPQSGPARLSIVVLPFINLSGDFKEDYFVDGVTDSLTTDLYRLRGAFVIARSTAFTYKGRPVDVRAAGRELNVRCALEGSVQRCGDRMRVNVQLIDTESGRHLWAERFDNVVADFFDLQDEIVGRLSNQLSAELVRAEARSSETAPNPDSLDLFFQGLAWILKGSKAENLSRARSFFEQALTLDPDNVNALVEIAIADVIAATSYHAENPSARLAAAQTFARKAVSLDPENPFAHFGLACVFSATNHAEQALSQCQRALTINPSLANAHALMGLCRGITGHPEATEAHVRHALRLSPRDAQAFRWLHWIGVAKSLLGEHLEAAGWLRRSVEANRNDAMSHFILAAALALADQPEEARAAVEEGLALNPSFSIARYMSVQVSDNADYVIWRKLIAHSLLGVGVPRGDCDSSDGGDPLARVRGKGVGDSDDATADRSKRASPPRLSMIVLPFDNLTGDASRDYFVDGVTESLTTDLSCQDGMVVIGRNTAFTYKGKAVDLREIGRELNVRYVLEGSVQRGGNRIRVNVLLVDAGTGNHLWAERFDKTLADLFEMQDEIVGHVANALTAQITETEARRTQRTLSPDAVDLYFQGMAWFNRGPTLENLMRAQGCFERAVEVDPDNVWALVGVGRAHVTVAAMFYPNDRAERIAAAEAAVTKALSSAPDYSLGHLCLGQLRILKRQPEKAIAAFERTIGLNRNLAHAQAHIGFAKVFVGRADEAEAHVREALQLSPRDMFAYVWFGFLGYAKLSLGLDEEAAVWLRRATIGDRVYPIAYFWLAAALAHCGRIEDAQVAAGAGLSNSPTMTISRFRATTPSDNPVFLRNRERFYDGLRKAGVPER